MWKSIQGSGLTEALEAAAANKIELLDLKADVTQLEQELAQIAGGLIAKNEDMLEQEAALEGAEVLNSNVFRDKHGQPLVHKSNGNKDRALATADIALAVIYCRTADTICDLVNMQQYSNDTNSGGSSILRRSMTLVPYESPVIKNRGAVSKELFPDDATTWPPTNEKVTQILFGHTDTYVNQFQTTALKWSELNNAMCLGILSLMPKSQKDRQKTLSTGTHNVSLWACNNFRKMYRTLKAYLSKGYRHANEQLLENKSRLLNQRQPRPSRNRYGDQVFNVDRLIWRLHGEVERYERHLRMTLEEMPAADRRALQHLRISTDEAAKLYADTTKAIMASTSNTEFTIIAHKFVSHLRSADVPLPVALGNFLDQLRDSEVETIRARPQKNNARGDRRPRYHGNQAPYRGAGARGYGKPESGPRARPKPSSDKRQQPSQHRNQTRKVLSLHGKSTPGRRTENPDAPKHVCIFCEKMMPYAKKGHCTRPDSDECTGQGPQGCLADMDLLKDERCPIGSYCQKVAAGKGIDLPRNHKCGHPHCITKQWHAGKPIGKNRAGNPIFGKTWKMFPRKTEKRRLNFITRPIPDVVVPEGQGRPGADKDLTGKQ